MAGWSRAGSPGERSDEAPVRLLVESFAALAAEHRVEAALEQAAALARSGCDAGVAAAATAAGGRIDACAWSPRPPAGDNAGYAGAGDTDLLDVVAEVIATARPVRRRGPGATAWAGVPLAGSDWTAVLGAIAVGRTGGQGFDDDDALFLAALARQVTAEVSAARRAHAAELSASPRAGAPPVDLTPAGVTRLGIIEASLASAREQLGMDVALVSEFTGGRQVFRMVEGDGEGFGLRVDAGVDLRDTYCDLVVAGRLPEVIPDTAAEPRVCHLPGTTSGALGAYIGVPVRLSDGSLFGTLCCLSHQPQPSLDEGDVRFMRALARLVASQLEAADARRGDRRLTAERVRLLLEPGRVRALFQPVVSLADGGVVGFEALARFDAQPDQGPDVWLAEAAGVGLGADVEQHALAAAIAEMHAVPAGTFLSVNVSPAFLASGRVTGALAGVPLERVVIELTEHARVDDYDALASALRPLRDAGARVAVDDAGAGFASLRHVLRLTPEVIKLDVSLTGGVDSDPVRAALAASLVEFAGKVDAVLVAEGIETASQCDTLRRLGVTHGQGFHLGAPAPLPAGPRV